MLLNWTMFEADLDRRLSPVFHAVLSGDADLAWRLWIEWRADWSARTGTPPAETDDIYCASSQSAYRWLGSVRGPGGVAAQRLLTLSRCARSIATLCSVWARADALDGHASTVFEDVHGLLAAELTKQPPRELPGCAGCPARCLMLPLVAPMLEGVRQAVSARATTKASAPSQVRAVASIPQVERALGELADRDQRDALLYCLVTNATADSETGPTDVLDTLRGADAAR